MLRTRVVTALVLVAGLALVLFVLPPWVAVGFFAIVASLASWEWAGLMKRPAAARIAFGAITFVLCMGMWAQGSSLASLSIMLSAAFWLLAVPFWLRFKWPLAALGPGGYLVGLLVILPTWGAMTSLHAAGVWLLLAAMALVWVADIAAYFSGRAFGRHKLAPSISPGKTWEGVAGAIAGVMAYGAVLMTATPLGGKVGLPVGLTIALLLLLTAVSVIGDLYESLLKRQAGIKDSSMLLPGHGGVLDRIDAQTSTLPLAALIMLAVRG